MLKLRPQNVEQLRRVLLQRASTQVQSAKTSVAPRRSSHDKGGAKQRWPGSKLVGSGVDGAGAAATQTAWSRAWRLGRATSSSRATSEAKSSDDAGTTVARAEAWQQWWEQIGRDSGVGGGGERKERQH